MTPSILPVKVVFWGVVLPTLLQVVFDENYSMPDDRRTDCENDGMIGRVLNFTS